MFHMASYDLDRFRRFVFESTFLERFDLDKDLIEEMRTDDTALFNFAFRWLRLALFGEPTLPVTALGRLGHLGAREHADLARLEALDVDLHTAGRRAELGK